MVSQCFAALPKLFIPARRHLQVADGPLSAATRGIFGHDRIYARGPRAGVSIL